MNSTPTPGAPERRYWPLAQLILARLREFYRKPEAVFWVYGFPIVMTVALGVAFRNRPVEQVRVDVAEGPGAAAAKEALAANKRFVAEVHDLDACRQRLRRGRIDLVVIAAEGGSRPRYE